MTSTEIAFVREVFALPQRALAKTLAVSSLTVARWERGTNVPTGLADDVLRALHTVALVVRDDPARRAAISGRLALGIGAVLYVGLREELARHNY